MKFQRILVRGTNWVGDAVMSIPALQLLHAAHPSAEISVLARRSIAALYEREPFCKELIPFEAAKGWSGWGAKLQLARELRGKQFDCAIALPNSFETAALFALARVPVRIGYKRDARGFLLTHPVAVPAAGAAPRHQRFYYLELLRRAGLIPQDSGSEVIQLARRTEAALAGRARFRSLGLTGPVIGVSPGAAFGGAKRWLPERFAEVAVHTAGEGNRSVAVFGTAGEADVCREVEQGIAARGGVQCISLAGRTTLSEFIELAAACELFFTNDSGPMHVASALGVRTVAVFGATDAEATGPVGRHTAVVRKPVVCSPCLLRECPIDHRCMTGVSAADTTAAATRLVGLSL